MNTASTPKPPRASGFWWALAGFGLGSLVSVGFNLQSAWLPANQHGPGWAPSIASQAAAIVWPLTLIVSVEVLSRVAWPNGWGWRLVRTSGILAVAIGSATISYGHIYEVLIAWGYHQHQAIVGPLVVDGLMLISGFALVSLGRAARVVLPASQEATAEPSVAPSRTPVVPAHPSPSLGQEPAVSVTTPTPETVTETAPQEASRLRPEEASQEGHGDTFQEARPGLRIVPSQKLVIDPKTTSRRASRKPSGRSASDEDVLKAIASFEQREHRLPTANWLKTNLSGVGASRAKDLLDRYSNDKQEALA